MHILVGGISYTYVSGKERLKKLLGVKLTHSPDSLLEVHVGLDEC